MLHLIPYDVFSSNLKLPSISDLWSSKYTWNAWLLLYLGEGKKAWQRGCLPSPLPVLNPSPNIAYISIPLSCILLILQHDMTFCALKELYSSKNYHIISAVEPWRYGVKEAQKMLSQCFWTSVKCLYLGIDWIGFG